MPSKNNNDFAVIDFRDLVLMHNKQNFNEIEAIPSDAKIINNTYQYVNKNGTPDRRYKHNPIIPIALYYMLELKTQKGLFEGFLFSNYETAEAFCIALQKYQNSLNNLNWNNKRLEGNIQEQKEQDIIEYENTKKVDDEEILNDKKIANTKSKGNGCATILTIILLTITTSVGLFFVNKPFRNLIKEKVFHQQVIDDDVKVKGYYRKNGTYLKPHTRKKPSKRK